MILAPFSANPAKKTAPRRSSRWSWFTVKFAWATRLICLSRVLCLQQNLLRSLHLAVFERATRLNAWVSKSTNRKMPSLPHQNQVQGNQQKFEASHWNDTHSAPLLKDWPAQRIQSEKELLIFLVWRIFRPRGLPLPQIWVPTRLSFVQSELFWAWKLAEVHQEAVERPP